jgi:hypothetical protein
MLPGKPKINNWAFETVPQPGLNGRRGYQPRGKALGGSSAINGMIYIRGHHTDYDDWAALGCEGWSWQEVLPYFKRAEGNERGADDFHGGDGPLRVANQRSPRPIASAFVEACAENQIRRNNDFNGPEQEGAGLYQVTQFWGGDRNGERCSTGAAYLHPVMNRPNLTVITDAQVTGIVFDGQRATGLSYRRDGREEVAEASREVILCCGTFGSPQLLLLSGVGPADEIRRHGIPSCTSSRGSARTCKIISITSHAIHRNRSTCSVSPRTAWSSWFAACLMAQGRNRPFLVARFGRRSLPEIRSRTRSPRSSVAFHHRHTRGPYAQDAFWLWLLLPRLPTEALFARRGRFDRQGFPGAAAH